MSLQHLVPRVVLRHFCRTAGRKQVISVRDLASGRTFPATLDRVAASNRFYDFVTESGETASIDPFLTDIESVTAPAWRKLAQTERIGELDERDRQALAVFVVTLAVRGPSIRAEIEALPDLILDALRQRGEVDEHLKGWLDDGQGREAEIHASTVAHVSRHYSAVAGRTWLLFRPPTGRHFCTSDSPVTQFNEIDHGLRNNLGLLTRGICLQVAISPTLLLVIADGDAYGLKEVDRVMPLGEEHLLHYNWLLARFAHRYLYAPSGLDFQVPDGAWIAGPQISIE